jgi:hypothetical protein
MLVKIQKKKYLIPTSWDNVTCSQFQQLLLAKDIFDRIHVLTGIPREIAENLAWDSIQIIFTAIEFSTDFTGLDGVNVYPKEFEGFDISQQPAHTILSVQGVIKSASNKFEDEFLKHLYCGVDILNIYVEQAKHTDETLSDINIYNEPITKWFGLMGFFLSKWVSFSISSAIYLTTNQANTKKKQVLKGSRRFPLISGLLNRLWRNSNKVQTIS